MNILKQWSCFSFFGKKNDFNLAFTDPQLCGVVYGHPRFEDGNYIITSKLIMVERRSIITQSGSHYILEGEPELFWLEYCEKNNIPYDTENPLAFLNFNN